MKQEKIIDALDFLPEEMLEQAQSERVKKKKKRRWPKWVAVAACLCLVIVGAWDTLGRLDYNFFEAGCGSFPGQFVGDDYYYLVPKEGVMHYTPGGESELALHTYWFEEWQVNKYGIYYWQDMAVYVKDHENGERRKLHSASWPECTHIRFDLREDGNVIFIGYNKDTEVRYELLLDGVTGEVLETIMAPTSYDDFEIAYSDAHKTIGEREVVLLDEGRDTLHELTENGANLLPEGMLVRRYSAEYWGGALWFNVWRKDRVDEEETYIILYPDGRNELVTLPSEYYYGGTTEYLFYPNVADGEVWCTEVDTGETWALDMDAETEDLHDLASNGIHLYTMAPWAEKQMCWKLEYDGDGRPFGLTLISSDIHGSDH